MAKKGAKCIFNTLSKKKNEKKKITVVWIVFNRASKFSYIQICDAHSRVVYSRAYAREDDNRWR